MIKYFACNGPKSIKLNSHLRTVQFYKLKVDEGMKQDLKASRVTEPIIPNFFNHLRLLTVILDFRFCSVQDKTS